MQNVIFKLLPGLWNREAIKQSLDKVHDATFDRRYEAMLKEKGIAAPPELRAQALTLDKLQPKRLQDYVDIKIQLPVAQAEETVAAQPSRGSGSAHHGAAASSGREIYSGTGRPPKGVIHLQEPAQTSSGRGSSRRQRNP